MVRPKLRIEVLLATATAFFDVTDVSAAKPSSASYPMYESVGTDKRSRVLIEGMVRHFGGADETAESLIASDIGDVLYFDKVAGGIRARSLPVVFPDGSRSHFEFDDFDCSIASRASSAAVSCISKLDGRTYGSLIESGGLVEFQANCFYVLNQLCRYRLISGQALRPSKIGNLSASSKVSGTPPRDLNDAQCLARAARAAARDYGKDYTADWHIELRTIVAANEIRSVEVNAGPYDGTAGGGVVAKYDCASDRLVTVEWER